ncbi:hypothetical protein NDA11_000748 [Ustilago hordei]|uniref:UPF3 domain-containing protein n=1 Tax=Ustilago hordei TaxID=120017 RepID=I2G465_USTHO|nr:uncharacterized protein UHO2_01088 [Ustilago hordei]KAJ1584474.1 hypothetical protein NDA11_000748 [Ustilago hordei]KAJ1603380.1 hypothetical protein NDA14_006144 [Ustilago hordei]CCF53958.1 uncharacterized protein UHOR_00367 [Ustilago hordei]SYW74223.1 uncharacterized protein UHO2_01088 [Ustilago hordei]
MSRPEPGCPMVAAAGDPQTLKVKAKEPVRAAATQDKATGNKAKAQQNRERGAQNRTQKNVRFIQDKSRPSSSKASSSTSAAGAGAKQPKKQVKKEVAVKKAAGQAQGKAQAQTQFKSKVVVRRLPPNLPEQVFWKAVSPWVRDAADCQAITSSSDGAEASSSTLPAPTPATPTVDFKSFIRGKLKSDSNKQNKLARAYIRFLDPTSLVTFHKNFDGHIFRDAKGKGSVSIVEFAPYQKVVLSPSTTGAGVGRGRRMKPDPKQGSIEKDADYLAFVEKLENVEDQGVKRSEGDLLASLWDPKEKVREREEQVEKGKMTPLLEHLRAVKMAKRESVARLKKANKAANKAVGKTTTTQAVPSASANMAASKGKAAETGIAVEAKLGKKEKSKKKSRKGKGGAEGIVVAEGGAGKKPSIAPKQADGQGVVQGSAAAKQAPKAPKKMAKQSQAAAVNEAKAKAKSPPSQQQQQRKKGGSKDKPSSAATTSATPAPTPTALGKMQILKRDT